MENTFPHNEFFPWKLKCLMNLKYYKCWYYRKKKKKTGSLDAVASYLVIFKKKNKAYKLWKCLWIINPHENTFLLFF